MENREMMTRDVVFGVASFVEMRERAARNEAAATKREVGWVVMLMIYLCCHLWRSGVTPLKAHLVCENRASPGSSGAGTLQLQTTVLSHTTGPYPASCAVTAVTPSLSV